MPTDRNLIKKQVTTYAQVLLEAAKTSNTVFEVDAQLADALTVIRGHMEFKDALNDATIDSKTRSSIVKEVFASYDPSLVAVLALMAERCEIKLLPRVCEAYNAAAEEATDTVVVDVTTVVELTDELREAIKRKLSADYGNKAIVLREHVDASIIGGIVMGAHGKRIDASVLSQLENARVVLSTVSGGGER